jgi:hypothetical protein
MNFFTPHTGGLSSLELLGHTDERGATVQTGRRWASDDNGNPEDMAYFVKSFLGTQDTTLFIVERNINRNVCHYQANLNSDGETLYVHAPVKPSWLMIGAELELDSMTEQDVDEGVLYEEPLSGVEPMVYGMTFLDSTHFELKAIPGETFTLEQNPVDSCWRALLTIQGHAWVVERIYLHTTKSALGFPSVQEVHIDVTHPDKDADKRSFYYSK